MKKTHITDLIKEIQILDIKPDQCLCVHLDSFLSLEIIDDIQKALKDYLGCKVVILQPGVELSVVNVEK